LREDRPGGKPREPAGTDEQDIAGLEWGQVLEGQGDGGGGAEIGQVYVLQQHERGGPRLRVQQQEHPIAGGPAVIDVGGETGRDLQHDEPGAGQLRALDVNRRARPGSLDRHRLGERRLASRQGPEAPLHRRDRCGHGDLVAEFFERDNAHFSRPVPASSRWP
jgi:hypothetical protein